MKIKVAHAVRLVLTLTPVLALLIYGGILAMQQLERSWVKRDLDQRASVLAVSLQNSIVDIIESGRPTAIVKLVQRLSRGVESPGIIICSASGKTLARSPAAPLNVSCGQNAVTLPASRFLDSGGELLHLSTHALLDDDRVKRGELLIAQNASYHLMHSGMLTRRYALVGFALLGLMASLVALLIYRWNASSRAERLSRAIKGLIRGDISKVSNVFRDPEWQPLIKDINKVLREIRQKKRLGKVEEGAPRWNADTLRDEVKRLFGESKLCVIANREPYVHNRKGKKIETLFPASGLVTAVEPIVRACTGLWVGHGSGTADRETADKRGVILVPPGNPEYALKRVWLSREEEQGYYFGFANEGLWPLCHIAHTRPTFRPEDWNQYVAVNEKFAQAFIEESTDNAPIALIQDYHFALLPGILRRRRPDAVTSLFWHIPWPNPENIRICPWKKELLEGMLGADLIGFHIQYHCNNFLDTVDRFLEARVDRENFSVTMKGHTCYVRPFPISIEWPPKHDVAGDSVASVRAKMLDELVLPPDAKVAVGVDRLDYTKGIVERLLAVERLLEKHTDLVGRFVFIQISAPSRTQIKRYQDLEAEVRNTASRINYRFGKPGYEPVMLRTVHHDSEEVFRFYRTADVCVVTSLHDGMNLVAKEFIASRSDERGVLLLSTFTGAARELSDAVMVNPYDVEETADGLYRGLTMDDVEMQGRMSRLRTHLTHRNVYDWAVAFLREVHKISERKPIEAKEFVG